MFMATWWIEVILCIPHSVWGHMNYNNITVIVHRFPFSNWRWNHFWHIHGNGILAWWLGMHSLCCRSTYKQEPTLLGEVMSPYVVRSDWRKLDCSGSQKVPHLFLFKLRGLKQFVITPLPPPTPTFNHLHLQQTASFGASTVLLILYCSHKQKLVHC